MERKEKAGEVFDINSLPAKAVKVDKTPNKRKAPAGGDSSSKKTKSGGPVKQPSTSADEDDDEDGSED